MPKFIPKDDKVYKTLKFEEMAEFIEKHAPEDKEWFKEIAFQDKDGKPVKKYNHLNAKKKFLERYAPEYIPEKKEIKRVTDILKDW